MEEAVRVELVFPRSGQQLWVFVPRQWAQAAQARLTSHQAAGGDFRHPNAGLKNREEAVRQ